MVSFKNESNQEVKFQQTKDKLARDKDEFRRKLNAGEFEDAKKIVLTKSDAELNKLQKIVAPKATKTTTATVKKATVKIAGAKSKSSKKIGKIASFKFRVSGFPMLTIPLIEVFSNTV